MLMLSIFTHSWLNLIKTAISALQQMFH